MAVCLVCGKYEEVGLTRAMKDGWVFNRCPECHRGTSYDIIALYLSRTMPEEYIEGFCQRHWFRDTGICGYCKMKREGTRGDVS